MTSTIATDDLAELSDLLADAADQPAPPGGLPDALLAGLAELVGCDLVSFLDFDIAIPRSYLDQEHDGAGGPALLRGWEQDCPFWQHFWAALSCSYPNRTGDDRSVTLLSDFYSQREWQATPLYRECFADAGVQHELMCSLPSKGTRTRRLLLDRHGGVDFDDRSRMLLALARPHLAELQARNATHAAPQVLTPRQVELLRLVAHGRSTSQIAETLFLSPFTVRKHLENIFERLGVTSRTAAVMAVFTDDLPVP